MCPVCMHVPCEIGSLQLVLTSVYRNPVAGITKKDVFVTGNCLFVLFCSQATLLMDIYADIDIYSQQPLMQTSKQTIKHA